MIVNSIGETRRHLVIPTEEHLDWENSHKNSEVKTHFKDYVYCKNHVNIYPFDII